MMGGCWAFRWSQGPRMVTWSLVAVTTWLALAGETATSRCPSYEHDLDGIRCCRRCLPGSGMASPCNEVNDTICTSCVPGETYSPHHSHEKPCHPCKECPEHSHPKHKCNVTHNTVCECDKNYYFDEDERKCRLCDLCPVGHGASRVCGGLQNTKCRRCPNGTFSDRRSAQGCRVCAVCGHHQVMLQGCSNRQSTVCVDLPNVRSTLPSHLARGTDQHTGTKNSNHSDVIPLYCALLGLVVAGLLIYVIVKHCRRDSSKNKNKLPLGYSVEVPSGILEHHKPGSDSGVYMEIETKPVTQEMRVREIPSYKCRVLESFLIGPKDGGGGWRSLARELGYSNSRIASFEARAEQDGHSPIRYLLAEWGKSSSATVAILIRALKNIGRDDVVKVLLSDSKEFPSHRNIPQMV